MKEFKNEPLLGTRRVEETGEGPKLGGYEWMSYKETEDIVNNLARGFLDKNLCPKVEGDPQFENTREMRFLGIYAKNRAEWVLCDQAMMAISGTTIPYYDTLGEPAIYYITELTQLSTIALTSECLPRIISYKLDPVGHHKMRTLKNLLIMDKLEEGMEEEARAAGLSIFHFHDLLDAGRQSTSSLIPATRSTVASICFTSGTTGNPKGVIITHGNLLGCVAGIVKTKWYSASAEDRYLSYLPLAHMWERLMVQVNITRGVSIGFYNGNVFKLKEDLAALKPSLMISVPRLYYRFYDVIKNKIQETSGVKRMLIDRALKVKLENLRKTGETKHYLYDKLVFNQMKKVLGGNVRTMCSGSAPIAPEVLDFLKICFCAPICEGYGQTESCAGGCVTVDDDHFSGHCGSPWLCQEIKLVDIPHLHYFATDSDAYGKPAPRGEICLRGTNITQGYFKTPDKTKETIDSDGWLHTGDVGIFLQGGRLKIIDRISNCFKLQQGEYIAAEKLENVYIKCPYLAQIFVYGDGMRNYLVALGTLDRENVFKWAKQTGKWKFKLSL